MNIQREIIKTINVLADKAIRDRMSEISLDIAATIKEIKTETRLEGDTNITVPIEYKVSIDGTDYWLKVGTGITPIVGQSVWVHIPNGKYTNAYILAYKT